jgi:hypothetical protein
MNIIKKTFLYFIKAIFVLIVDFKHNHISRGLGALFVLFLNHEKLIIRKNPEADFYY